MTASEAPVPRADSHHLTNAKVRDLVLAEGHDGRRFVDVGSGEGYFVYLLGKAVRERGGDPAAHITGSEINQAKFRHAEIPCVPLEPEQALPFAEGSCDVATCIEVIEHVENQFALVRELTRIVKPGGRVIVTTPNILSLPSRLQWFATGFADMFPPEDVKPDFPGMGHVHPIGAWYLAYIFMRAGLSEVTFHIDRRKHSAIALLPLCWPFIALRSVWFRRRLGRSHPQRLIDHGPLMRAINGLDLLTGRTLIVSGRKPA